MGIAECPLGQVLKQLAGTAAGSGGVCSHTGRFAGLVSRSFQLPSATSLTGPPLGTWLMSTTIRFGTTGLADSVGVEIHSRARPVSFGSAHRYISCGFTCCPEAEVGT